MSDEHDCLPGPLPYPLELFLQRITGLRIQRRERLVHQQDLRLHGQAPRKLNSLLHAA
jgi:hypothetical protein